jgi:hypothetical protein
LSKRIVPVGDMQLNTNFNRSLWKELSIYAAKNELTKRATLEIAVKELLKGENK